MSLRPESVLPDGMKPLAVPLSPSQTSQMLYRGKTLCTAYQHAPPEKAVGFPAVAHFPPKSHPARMGCPAQALCRPGVPVPLPSLQSLHIDSSTPAHPKHIAQLDRAPHPDEYHRTSDSHCFVPGNHKTSGTNGQTPDGQAQSTTYRLSLIHI